MIKFFCVLSPQTRLATRWASVDWHDVAQRQQQQPQQQQRDEQRDVKPERNSNQFVPTARYVASGVNPALDNVAALRALVTYIDQLALLALPTHDTATTIGIGGGGGHALLQLSVLAACEQLVALHRRFGAPFVHVPSESLLLAMLLSRHAVVVARACALLATCRAELAALRVARNDAAAAAKSSTTTTMRDGAEQQQSGLERGAIVDAMATLYCDALWRARLFPERKDVATTLSDLNLDASITCQFFCAHAREAAL
jgi:hypothetical protein